MPSESFQSIRILCDNDDGRSESELVEQLKLILSANPDLAREIDGLGKTLLYHAAANCSPEFCKLLVELNTKAVKTTSDVGELPLHHSCFANNVETAK